MSVCFRCGKELVPCCPECGGDVDVYSRVVGYLRPTKLWNDGKQQEFADRKTFTNWDGDHIEYQSGYDHFELKDYKG